MTPEEIKKMFDEQEKRTQDMLMRRDSATLDLMAIREDYMDRFKKRLNVGEFEKAWKEHPEWGMGMQLAYEKFIEPEVKQADADRIKKEKDDMYQQGLRDGYSRKHLPTDSSAKEFSPMFDRDANIDKMDEAAQEKHSREQFFAGFTEKTPA